MLCLICVRAQIYHPNIDHRKGHVCLHFDKPVSELKLEDVVLGLIFVLHNPNLEDPVSDIFDGGKYLDRQCVGQEKFPCRNSFIGNHCCVHVGGDFRHGYLVLLQSFSLAVAPLSPHSCATDQSPLNLLA